MPNLAREFHDMMMSLLDEMAADPEQAAVKDLADYATLSLVDAVHQLTVEAALTHIVAPPGLLSYIAETLPTWLTDYLSEARHAMLAGPGHISPTE